MKELDLKDFLVFELNTEELKDLQGGDLAMYHFGYALGWLIGNSRAPHYMVGG